MSQTELKQISKIRIQFIIFLTTSFTTTFEYLNDNGKGAVAVMVLAGGFVEGLYLSTELAGMIDKNADIITRNCRSKSDS